MDKCGWVILFLMSAMTDLNAETIDEGRPKSVLVRPEMQSLFMSSDSNTHSDEPGRALRVARTTRSTCKYPSQTEDSEIFCKIYPSKITCKHTCMFGYAFPEGKTRTMTCNFDENQWSPFRRFEACQPYVDCTLSLNPGGSMKCYTHYMDHGPICEVACKHYEDKDSIPKKSYQCDAKGKWTPSLPHCVNAGSGITLLAARRSYYAKDEEE